MGEKLPCPSVDLSVFVTTLSCVNAFGSVALKNVTMESGELLVLLCAALIEGDIRLYGKE